MGKLTDQESEPILEARNVHKWYGKIHALKDFNFEIRPGEAVGLVGDNGAGKSTFAKIIAGVIEKNDGAIYWKGEEVEISSIEDARQLGIETVYQEQALVNELSVAKNIFLGREITQYGPLGALDMEQMESRAQEVTEKLGLRMEPTQEVRFCSGGERQGVAVARALLFRANLVILDEPTRALSSKGVEKILNFIRDMKEEGIAVILISHIFPQIFPVSDRFVVLSRGEKVAEKAQEETSPDELSEMIVKRSK
ncbi:sugar ABC transporter ATP-binding protein [Candidatus Bipolaricaulota bacterium]|nr:sugar ABC transporter ATP-binding protein [Candidatus Bipolaricaulota bacterium]